MILFKPEHVRPIVAALPGMYLPDVTYPKTETRRLGKRRWREGAVRKCYVTPPFSGGLPFAEVRIERVWQERVRDLTVEGAHREGYSSLAKYRAALSWINQLGLPHDATELLDLEVWAIRFLPLTVFDVWELYAG